MYNEKGVNKEDGKQIGCTKDIAEIQPWQTTIAKAMQRLWRE